MCAKDLLKYQPECV